MLLGSQVYILRVHGAVFVKDILQLWPFLLYLIPIGGAVWWHRIRKKQLHELIETIKARSPKHTYVLNVKTGVYEEVFDETSQK